LDKPVAQLHLPLLRQKPICEGARYLEIRAEGHFQFDDAIDTRSIRRLSIDLSNMTYANIYGLVGIACCVADANQEGRVVSFIPPNDAGASCFLSRLGLDNFIRDTVNIDCYLPVISRQSDSGIIVEIQWFRCSDDLIPLERLLFERLEGIAGPQSREALCAAMWELGANVTEHAEARGIVAAIVQGTGKKDQHIDFAIGDVGIGIRESFLRGDGKHRPATDHKAVKLAVEYLVSSLADPGRGQGLSTTVEEATGLGGMVIVRSGNERLTISRKRDTGNLDRLQRSISVPRLPGTLVAVRVPCR
jgi:hypothetical protein